VNGHRRARLFIPLSTGKISLSSCASGGPARRGALGRAVNKNAASTTGQSQCRPQPRRPRERSSMSARCRAQPGVETGGGCNISGGAANRSSHRRRHWLAAFQVAVVADRPRRAGPATPRCCSAYRSRNSILSFATARTDGFDRARSRRESRRSLEAPVSKCFNVNTARWRRLTSGLPPPAAAQSRAPAPGLRRSAASPAASASAVS